MMCSRFVSVFPRFIPLKGPDVQNQCKPMQHLLHGTDSNTGLKNPNISMNRGEIREMGKQKLPKIEQTYYFRLYGSWEALVVCKKLLPGVARISTQGRPNSENFTVCDLFIHIPPHTPNAHK